MKTLTLIQSGRIALTEKPLQKPEEGEVLIRVKAAALNHRDQWIRENKYPGIKPGVTLGSDGAGIVEEVAGNKGREWIGKEVVIHPGINWGVNPEAQSGTFEILGMPRDGTFAEYVIVPADRIFNKPLHLNMAQAAAIPLAGVTAYRALFYKGGLKEGEKVLISGIGGGVAQFAFQYAKAAGAEVWVTSGHEHKRKNALEKGANGGFSYKEKDWPVNARQESGGGFDLVIDGAGGDQMNQLINTMKPGGRLVFYGATTGIPSSLDLRKIFWNQLRIQGSTMGSDQDFKEMLAFTVKHRLEPVMEEPVPFEKITDAFDKMAAGSQLGKLVAEMG